VTDMHEMFQNATLFNQNLSRWDMSNVQRKGRILDGATSFRKAFRPGVVKSGKREVEKLK
jgi:hypothetical protein